MKLSEFRNRLTQAAGRRLRFVLPDGDQIEAHAHIVEAGRVEKAFIDCGGTLRKVAHCSRQAWVADELSFLLTWKEIDCLVRDLCLPSGSERDLSCSAGSGCC